LNKKEEGKGGKRKRGRVAGDADVDGA